ncbi:MAG: hypothetical protein F4174_01095 [Acidobacteria bacterium]|nr:hypothetical protein [Acidobacteriota bacterium]
MDETTSGTAGKANGMVRDVGGGAVGAVRGVQQSGIHGLATALGIHPVPALVVISVDWMLFANTMVTLGTGWIVSVPVGAVLAVAVVLFQHRGSPHDDLWLAGAKGLFVGVLTAIPTALPSFLVLGQGTVGGVAIYLDHRMQKRLGDPGNGSGDTDQEAKEVVRKVKKTVKPLLWGFLFIVLVVVVGVFLLLYRTCGIVQDLASG